MVTIVDQFVPAAFLARIRAAHQRGREAMLRAGIPENELEPTEVAEMVEAHRWAWKPKRVKLVLLAESHVYTSQTDFATIYRLPSGVFAPNRYVRLIYCLAYGEKILAPGLGGGTPQFWKIFGELAGTPTNQQYGGPADARLQSWITTLRTLDKLGVWLLDSSLHGIYRGSAGRIDGELTTALQKIWWDDYGRLLLEQTSPQRVIAVGKGVHDTLSRETDIKLDGWIYQPQGARHLDQIMRNREVLKGLRGWLLADQTSGK